MGERGADATIQVGDAATQTREGCRSKLVELEQLHSSPQMRTLRRVAQAMFLGADFYLSTQVAQGKSRGACLASTFDGAVSGRRTFLDKPNAT